MTVALRWRERLAASGARGYPARMSDEVGETEDSEGEGRVTTPFEKPFFMPVLLFLLMLWFGYDGWFNPEIESIGFNRAVFGVLILLCAYTTWQDVRDLRRSKH